MQKNKHLLFSLCFLFGLLVFVSCQKEAPIVEEPKIGEPIIEEPVLSEIEVANLSVSGIFIIYDVFDVLFNQSISNPEILFGLHQNIAVTRADCPTTSSAGTAPGSAGSPYVLLLTFDDCTPERMLPGGGQSSQTQPVTIDGLMDFSFEGAVFQTNGDEVLVTLKDNPATAFSGFKIGDYTITDADGGDIDLPLKVINNGSRYQIIVPSAITVTDGAGNTTVYPATTDFGNINFVDQDSNDDVNNPLTYIENELRFNVKQQNVTCTPNGGSGVPVTIVSSEIGGGNTNADRLRVRPFDCGCIFNGALDINVDNGGAVKYDFGVDMAGGASNACNEYVSAGGTVQTMASCN